MRDRERTIVLLVGAIGFAAIGVGEILRAARMPLGHVSPGLDSPALPLVTGAAAILLGLEMLWVACYLNIGCPRYLDGREKHTSFSLEIPLPPDRYEVLGYEMLEKTVVPGNATRGRINMPLRHVGKRVKVIVLDP